MTSIYAFTAGQALTALALNNAINNIMPVTAIKVSDTTRSSTTTFADDPDLTVPVAANINYYVDAMLLYDTAATPLIKFQLTVPSGATRYWVFNGLATSVTATGDGVVRLSDKVNALGTAGAGSITGAPLRGTVLNGSTAGFATLQWAQNVSNAANTILKAGSWLRLIPQPA